MNTTIPTKFTEEQIIEWLRNLSTEDKRAVFKVWLDTCPFEYEFSDETEGESEDEPCLWYFFRIR